MVQFIVIYPVAIYNIKDNLLRIFNNVSTTWIENAML